MTDSKKISEQLKKMEETKIKPKELMFFIYENYEAFFLQYINEDERYDFIVSLLPILERVSLTFDKRKSSLEQYLRFIISHNRASWKRNSTKKLIKEELIEEEYRIELSEDFINDDEEFFETYSNDELPDIPDKLKRILPIIAYKASVYVTPSQIQKIARISRTNVKEMFRIISTLNERLETRMNNVKKVVQRNTSAYLLRKRYALEKELLEDSETIKYEKISKKAVAKQISYENSQMNTITTQIVTPSWLIAEVLGVSVYTIDNYLKYVHKLFPEFYVKKQAKSN